MRRSRTAPRDDITDLYPEILRADGLALATPAYWANMSAVMKNFIEHLTPLENDGFLLEGKVAAVIAASKENEGGIEMAAMSLVVALIAMGILFSPSSGEVTKIVAGRRCGCIIRKCVGTITL